MTAFAFYFFGNALVVESLEGGNWAILFIDLMDFMKINGKVN